MKGFPLSEWDFTKWEVLYSPLQYIGVNMMSANNYYSHVSDETNKWNKLALKVARESSEDQQFTDDNVRALYENM